MCFFTFSYIFFDCIKLIFLCYQLRFLIDLWYVEISAYTFYNYSRHSSHLICNKSMYLLLYEHSRYISFYIRIGEKASMQRSIRFSYLQFACIFATWEVKGLYHIKWTLEAEINAAFVSYEFSCYFEIKQSNEDERAKNRNRVLLLTKKIISWNAKTWLNF